MRLGLKIKTRWQFLALVMITLATRVYLLREYDIELSQDGFDIVATLNAIQSHGLASLANEGITRLVLHPLYALLLAALKFVTPASFDFFLAARLLSTFFACVAILLLFEFTRRAFGETAAWIAALFFAFAPTVLWESIAILSSTLFLALYLAVLVAIHAARYRVAALCALLAALTRLEGVVLFALIFFAMARAGPRPRADWFAFFLAALAAPLTIFASSWVVSGNAFAFVGAQSIAAIWLRFLAPGDFLKRAAFFLTQYAQLVPVGIVWLGIFGAGFAIWRARARAVMLLVGTSALYLIFFETLVWFNYTTLETRFLMYPGLPLIVFAGVALASARDFIAPYTRAAAAVALIAAVSVLLAQSYQQGIAGLDFIYNSYTSQREIADELARRIPPQQKTNLLVYTGTAGALDYYARARGLQFTYADFRFAPDENPEQYVIEQKIQFVIYPVGNAFGKAKYPYLARFETQTQRGVTFQPLTQFSTTPDNQLYSLWAVTY
ncbi:MAG: hypothetical protein HY070_04935 [Chloroflexi bacterium]|nr:hypothetical protein [Chloroflexota bacterium]